MFLGILADVPRPPATSGAVAPRNQVESAIAKLVDRDFAVLQYEANMQSLAHNYHKHMKGSHSVNVTYEYQLPPTEDGSSAVDSIAVEGHASAEETVSDLQELSLVEAGISILRAQLAQHPESLAIFDGLLEGKEKKEIREDLNIAWTTFWSADRRLTRAIEAYRRSI